MEAPIFKNTSVSVCARACAAQILLPSARHLEEGKRTTEAGKVHKQVVPQPPLGPPPPNTQMRRKPHK